MLKIPTRRRVKEILSRASSTHIVVMGDVMLDHYLFGPMETSAESPFVKLRIEREEFRLGGAANVSHNLAHLGAKVTLIGLAGNTHRAELGELLKRDSIEPALVFVEDRPMTIKRRYVAAGAVEFRADSESRRDASRSATLAIGHKLKRHVAGVSAVIISDYQKGVVTKQTLRAAIEAAASAGIPTFIDPKFRHAGFYKGAEVLKLNEKEATRLLGRDLENEQEYEYAGKELLHETGAEAVLLTRGKKGMMLFESSHKMISVQTDTKEVFDVVGAGDTVMALLALMRCCGATYLEAAMIANIAAGIVVGKMGTATVAAEELIQTFPS